jgi:hypothetical protein
MHLRRVRFSNGATNLHWVRLYTAQYVLFSFSLDWNTLAHPHVAYQSSV